VTFHWFDEVLIAADMDEAVLPTNNRQRTHNYEHLVVLRLKQPTTQAASLFISSIGLRCFVFAKFVQGLG